MKIFKKIVAYIIVGSRFGGSFTVGVSEPEPNKLNTMNLVEKRAQELGFVRTSSTVGQDRQRRRGGVKVCPWASSEDDFFFSSSDTTQLGPSGVFRIALFSSSWDLSGYIFFCSLHPAVHLLLVQVATWVSVSSSASLNLLWVAVDRVTLFRGHSFINAARLPAAGI